jgi:hypothetical protein
MWLTYMVGRNDQHRGIAGTFDPTITIIATDRRTASTVDEEDVAGITGTGGSLTGAPSSSISGTLGFFTDSASNAGTNGYTASINWEDGSSATAGTLTYVGTLGFAVTGTHSYTAEGTYNPVVTITHTSDSRTGTFDVGVNVTTITLTSQAISGASEGSTFTGTVATFRDTNSGTTPADYSATVDWGDGNQTPGVITENSGGTFSVLATNVFAMAGNLDAVVTVADLSGASATCTDAPDVEGIYITPVTIAANADGTFTGGVASFTDSSYSSGQTYDAYVSYGNGIWTTGTVTGSAGTYTVIGTNTFSISGDIQPTVEVVKNTGLAFSLVGTSDPINPPAPSTPTYSVDPSGTAVTLSWTETNTSTLTGFEIEGVNNDDSGTNYQTLYSTTNLTSPFSAVISGLTDNGDYSFEVRAVGIGVASLSAPVDVSVPGTPSGLPTTETQPAPPEAPSSAAWTYYTGEYGSAYVVDIQWPAGTPPIASGSDLDVVVYQNGNTYSDLPLDGLNQPDDWVKYSSVDGYEFYLGNNQDGDEYGDLGDEFPGIDTTQPFRVELTDWAGDSGSPIGYDVSTIVSVEMPAMPGSGSVPGAPTNLTAQVAGANTVDLAWRDNSDDETGFIIERKLDTDPSSSWATVGFTQANVTTFVDGTVPSTTNIYDYRVYAAPLVLGTSVPSNVATTQPAPEIDSIDVRVFTDATHKSSNSNTGYEFFVLITLKGKNLDEVVVNQLVQSKLDETDFNGKPVSAADLLKEYPAQDGDLIETNGNTYQQDPGWSGYTPPDHINATNTEATWGDDQALQLPGKPSGISGVTQSVIASLSRQNEIEATQKGSTKILKTQDWSYTWSTDNLRWTAPNPPSPSCTDSRNGGGKFDSHGIEGL